jgi:hypothetical protein
MANLQLYPRTSSGANISSEEHGSSHAIEKSFLSTVRGCVSARHMTLSLNFLLPSFSVELLLDTLTFLIRHGCLSPVLRLHYYQEHGIVDQTPRHNMHAPSGDFLVAFAGLQTSLGHLLSSWQPAIGTTTRTKGSRCVF